MRSWLKKLGKDDRGVAAVEYALMVPLLSLMLAGTVDYGMYSHKKMLIQDLARDVGQYMLQGGNESDIQANVIQQSSIYAAENDKGRQSITYTLAQQCECANGTVVTCSAGNCGTSDYVRSFYVATVTATYTPIVPWPGMSGNKTLTGYSKIQYNW